ncbi:GatB/YqeY domain-containing protein [Pelagibacteraceae bacterium]|nr:GatB/YqeY domain-containing protein [Pelagibacteraceae bacterium]
MSLVDKIDEKYKISIKEKDNNSINTLRLIKSSIKDKEIALRSKQEKLLDKDILSLLQNMIKQRKDSIEAFAKANRNDLIEKEKNEVLVIEKFLPQQLSEGEAQKIIAKIIQENNLSSLKDMGKLMSIIKKNYVGQIDMGVAGKIAKSSLGN